MMCLIAMKSGYVVSPETTLRVARSEFGDAFPPISKFLGVRDLFTHSYLQEETDEAGKKTLFLTSDGTNFYLAVEF